MSGAWIKNWMGLPGRETVWWYV